MVSLAKYLPLASQPSKLSGTLLVLNQRSCHLSIYAAICSFTLSYSLILSVRKPLVIYWALSLGLLQSGDSNNRLRLQEGKLGRREKERKGRGKKKKKTLEKTNLGSFSTQSFYANIFALSSFLMQTFSFQLFKEILRQIILRKKKRKMNLIAYRKINYS